MIETKKVWFDGRIVPRNDAKVDILTHALHYGAAVFEGIRCYKTTKGSAIFRGKDHTRRLLNSAKILQMPVTYTAEQLLEAMKQTVRSNDFEECYVRPLIFYGLGSMGLNPLKARVQVAIMAWNWGAYLGKEGLEKGIRCRVSSYQRHYHNAMMTKAKCAGNYPNSILAKLEAVNDGFDEAILLDPLGFVSECSGENIFAVRDGVLLTPPKTNILEGITRESVIRLAKDMGIEVREENMSRDQLYIADEIFLSGTAAELTPVREVDRRQIGTGKPGPLTLKIQKKFFDVVHGKDAKYASWLDKV